MRLVAAAGAAGRAAARSAGTAALTANQAWRLLQRTASDWSEDKAPKLAAALAYYTVFSLAPLLVLAVIGLSTFMSKGEAKAKIEGQQGLSTQKASRSDTRGEDHGGLKPPYRQPAPGRQVVTIEQPSQMNRAGYLLAAGGLAAGAILGATGVMTGRKWGEPRLTAMQINERLDRLEQRIGQERSLKRYGKELALMERVARIDQRVTDAAKSLKRTVDPPWYVKLTRKAKKPTPWYSRIREYVS